MSNHVNLLGMQNGSNQRGQVWAPGNFVGGAICLDFVNTQGGQDKTRDLERLATFQDAIDWARLTKTISSEEGRALEAAALKAPEKAARCLEQLQAFRECLYRLFAALAIDQAPRPDDEGDMRRAVAAAIGIARLERHEGGCVWTIDVEKAGLCTLLGRITLDAQRLMLGSELPFVRECDRCSWLFVDRTKNKRRRWCNTETCGNRTRAARHYRLMKSTGPA